MNMKSFFFHFLLFVGWPIMVSAQSRAEMTIHEDLRHGKTLALESVLRAPEKYSPVILYFGATLAFQKNRLEDSAFLYYAGQLRAHFDRDCFPPRGTGGDSPFVAYAALSQEIGRSINPAVMAEPRIFDKVLERIKKFIPVAPREYDPGYEFSERKPEQAAQAGRNEYIDTMSGLSALLNDSEYFAAFRVVRDSNRTGGNQHSKKYEEAVATMKRIERAKGINGFFGKAD
jgi:hypothetical protein